MQVMTGERMESAEAVELTGLGGPWPLAQASGRQPAWDVPGCGCRICSGQVFAIAPAARNRSSAG
jgi:hypothetical protein